MINDTKPGVIGTIGGIGTALKQGVVNEVKKAGINTLEQLDITGNKESKERLEAGPQAHQLTEEELKRQSQEAVNWLYPAPPETPPPPAVEKKPEVKADLKQQLGLEQTKGNTASAAEQFGIKNPSTSSGNNTANPLEQIGLGKDPNANTLSATDQLNVLPKPNLTPAQQQQNAQISGQLHNEYYQKLTTPQSLQSDTDERKEEAMEETETTAARMERLHREDEENKQKEDEKKQPIAVDQAQNAEKNRGSMG